VLIVEAMAQTAAVLVVSTFGADSEGKLVYFMSIDGARFRRPVVPGDQVLLSAQLERSLKGIWRFSTVAQVADQEVAHADMMVAPEAGR
jgi:3-hydroxyacyl-[acyl-carrier-protein] dehydratase